MAKAGRLHGALLGGQSRHDVDGTDQERDERSSNLFAHGYTTPSDVSIIKLVWARNTDPELFGRTHKFISIKEYVFHQLFGRYVIDYSIASATGMFNLTQLKWDTEAPQGSRCYAG